MNIYRIIFVTSLPFIILACSNKSKISNFSSAGPATAHKTDNDSKTNQDVVLQEKINNPGNIADVAGVPQSMESSESPASIETAKPCDVKLDITVIERMRTNTCSHRSPEIHNSATRDWDVFFNHEQIALPDSLISHCQIREESERLLGEFSEKCKHEILEGKTALDTFSPRITQFFHKSLKEELNTTIDPKNWNTQSVAAARALFGTTSKFYFYSYNTFVRVLYTKDFNELSESDLVAAKNFLNLIEEFGKARCFTCKTTDKYDPLKSFIEVSTRRSSEDFFAKNSGESLTDRMRRLKSRWNDLGLEHQIEEIEGSVKIYPAITLISVRP